MKKCVFFDRDGIVNRSPGPGYVEKLEDFELLPDFVHVLHAVRRLGYEAVIVTNQRGIARGLMTRSAVEEIHAYLRTVLAEDHGLQFLDILYCPHKENECECRKPKPGLLIRASQEHDIDLQSSWMVGDQEKDIEAGSSAGCRTILVTPEDVDTKADFKVKDLKALEVLLTRMLA
jgi:D-glycero-D-manno-heptose 1,7-bisphosphate phosphatase